MARPERPLDPQVSPGVAGFASELRALRAAAGSPSYRQMAAKTYFAATTLSEAAAGRRLPTLEVALAYAEACGGDRTDWERRWRAANASAPAAGGPGPAEVLPVEALPVEALPVEAGPVAAPPRPSRRHAVTSALGVLVVVAALILVGSGVFTTRPASGTPAPPRSASSSDTRSAPPGIADGQDPKQAGCGGDAQTLVSAPVTSPAGFVYGSLEMRYSPSCHAAWARYEPDANQPQPTTVTISVDRPSPVGATSVTFAVYTGGIYSDMELFKGGCVAVAATTVGVNPPATARTACRTEPS